MASVSKRTWTYKGVEKSAWTVRYLDRGGQHRSRQFDRKKEADEYRREVENELSAGSHVARRNSRTVSALLEEFTADVERRLADGQCGVGYVRRAKEAFTYARPVLGNILVRDLTWQDVERFALGLRTTNSRYGRHLAKRTAANILAMFSTAIGYAVRRGYAARNVVPDARREIGPAMVPRIETFSRAEIQALFVELENRPAGHHLRSKLMLRAMVYLAAVCGLRKGEIGALTWAAIDLDAGMIHVRASYDPRVDRIKAPKTEAGVRTIPLPRAVAATLTAFAPYVVAEPRGLIFTTLAGKPLSDRGLYSMWHPALQRAGMKPDANGRHRHFHALRHFAGSAWLEAGVSLAEVSLLLGHAHTAVTAEIYAHAVVATSHRSTEFERCARLIAPPIPWLAPAAVAQELRIGA